MRINRTHALAQACESGPFGFDDRGRGRVRLSRKNTGVGIANPVFFTSQKSCQRQTPATHD